MSKKHRCSSCGYVGEPIDADAPVLQPEPVYVPAVIIPMVVQQTRCPLCGGIFDTAEDYDAHRARNCAPAAQMCPVCFSMFDDPDAYVAHVVAATCTRPSDDTGGPGDTTVTDPTADAPAGIQE